MAKRKVIDPVKSKANKKLPAVKPPPQPGGTTDPKIRCRYARLVPISKIRPYPNNPNIHTAAQASVFAGILKAQGTRRPFRVSKLSGYLTAGHGQLEAYKINGWDMCPVDDQDYDDAQQEFADVVADNSLATWAQLDLDLVQKQIHDFGKDFDVNMLGVDGFSLDPQTITYPETRANNELTKDEKTTEYMAAQSRNIILVYSLPEFSRVTATLAEIMKVKSFESFSDAVSNIVEEYARGLSKKGRSK